MYASNNSNKLFLLHNKDVEVSGFQVSRSYILKLWPRNIKHDLRRNPMHFSSYCLIFFILLAEFGVN